MKHCTTKATLKRKVVKRHLVSLNLSSFAPLCRYAVPPEHGKRLERLAQGKSLTVVAQTARENALTVQHHTLNVAQLQPSAGLLLIRFLSAPTGILTAGCLEPYLTNTPLHLQTVHPIRTCTTVELQLIFCGFLSCGMPDFTE